MEISTADAIDCKCCGEVFNNPKYHENRFESMNEDPVFTPAEQKTNRFFSSVAPFAICLLAVVIILFLINIFAL